MKLRTFRAATMHEALAMVRRELGPEAALLHTREVRSRWLRWLPGPRLIEVTASCDVNVPSRLPRRTREEPPIDAVTQESARTVHGDLSAGGVDLSAKYEVRSAECGIRNVECGVEGMTTCGAAGLMIVGNRAND